MQVTTPPLPQLLYKWRKLILSFVFITTAAATVIALLLPKKYLSSAVVIPSNPKLTDKNFVYGNGTLELNSNFGTEEDLDRLLTNLRLSTNFSKMVDSFGLVKHYQLKENEKAKATAIATLVDNSSIVKTDNGAIKVSVYDKDAVLAAAITNAIVWHTAQQSNQQNQQANKAYYQSLQQTIAQQKQQIQLTDTITNTTIKQAEKIVLMATLEKNLTQVAQLKLAMQTNTAAIHVLESAYPSTKAAKPVISFWIIASFICSLMFSVLLVVLYDATRKRG